MDMPRAAGIRRGARRFLEAAGIPALCEFPLANGRRADLLGLDRSGRFHLLEIKSSRADFAADRKWRDYLGFADFFYFAVAPDFPLAVLPEGEGIVLCDAYEGVLLRPPCPRPLPAARRRALLLRFARTAAARLGERLDPPPDALHAPAHSQESMR